MIMRGDTLIEVLIALAIVVVVISAITTLGISSLNNAQYTTSQDQAAKYAQEGMEVVRKIRNDDYGAFANYDGIYCLGTNATLDATSSNCTSPNLDDHYIRTVEVRPDDGCGVDLSHTTVEVSWTDGKCEPETYCHTSRLSSCFSTLSPVQSP